ncbi:NAD-dependent epimerase/dehydratase family protein [Micromonospora sp. WMMD708]|uniref:NAD-dependent epimerase/dehydratase family protein n=1 Tax=Micromonospora sp. WMMD708 TaxID=3403464 RepID=UPI003BF57CFD
MGTSHRGGIAVPGVGTRRLDVTDRDAVRRLVAEVGPDVVVGTAYRTDDWTVTADGAAHVVYAAAEVGARLVHPSSGLVRPTQVRLDSSRAAGLLRTRLRGVAELLTG